MLFRSPSLLAIGVGYGQGMYVDCDLPESIRTWWVGRGINGGSAELEGVVIVSLYSMQAFVLAISMRYTCKGATRYLLERLYLMQVGETCSHVGPNVVRTGIPMTSNHGWDGQNLHIRPYTWILWSHAEIPSGRPTKRCAACYSPKHFSVN